KGRKMIKIIFLLIVGLIVLFAMAVNIGKWSFNKKVDGMVSAMMKQVEFGKSEIVTEKDIAYLPEPVQKCMRYSGVIGSERVRTVRLKMRGEIRMKKESSWWPTTAEEYYTVNPPRLIWKANVKVAPLVSFKVVDSYLDGKGTMLGKLFALFPLVKGEGPEMDEAGLMRYLNECTWFPGALIEDNIKWEAINEKSARATLTDGNLQATAIFYFDEQGRIVDFEAQRYNSDAKKKLKWTTPVSGYRKYGKINLASGGSAIWHSESGVFNYIRLEILDAEYNIPELY
ncbi:MAG: hypothetical protein JW737_01455, partial [Acidobacteria bacterium]|nr:hypothetical protein [Acidobacteriota bacterium]